MPVVLALRHVPHEGLGRLAALLDAAGLTYAYLDLFDDPPRRLDPADLAGLIVLGGPMNVDETDAYPHLAWEVEWLQAAVSRGVPVLGVCLGCQLLAKALGARVYPRGQKEIGFFPLELSPAAADDPLWAGVPPRPMVFHWHGDTFDLPAGAVHLASSAVCRNQAFRYGERAWGLQFHVEITGPLLERWLAEPGMCGELAGLGSDCGAAIRAAAPTELPRLAELADVVLGRFARACGGSKR